MKKEIIGTLLLASVMSINSNFASVSGAETGKVVINEICAKNTTIKHSDGNYYDWIELYNSSDEAVDLSGYGLSEKEKKPFKYTFPEGTIIDANSYLVVYCDKDQAAVDETIAGFSLSTDGETVILTSPDSQTVDKVTFSNMKSDVSTGRVPDGSDFFASLSMSAGQKNDEQDILVSPPVFSHDGGFYDDAFELSISCDDGYNIYYTTDGSIPTESSIKYSQPISIYDITSNDNDLSAEVNISALKPSVPSDNVDKAMIINAVAIDENGRKSEVITNSYFIGYNDRADYYNNVKVVSLVTDKSNLFDYNNGIYVLGRYFSEWYQSPDRDRTLPYYRHPANYLKSGMEWERPAVLQVYENGRIALSQNIGIRIHGGATRAYPQKSFNVYSRGIYGDSKIKYDFFNGLNESEYSGKTINKYDSIVLRNGGNDSSVLRFRDKFIQSLFEDSKFSNQAMEPCIVFINGEYWGQYEITEKVSDYFIESHFGVEKDNVCIIKNESLEEGDENSYNDFKNLYEWIKSPATDLSRPEDYSYFCSKVDINSYIEYMCANIYINNYDWGIQNTSLWKSLELNEENPYSDGKWRFMMFDTEYSTNLYKASSSSTSPNYDIFSKINRGGSFIFDSFNKLIANDEFKKDFYNSFMEISNNKLRYDLIESKINEISEQYRGMTTDVYRRFYSNVSSSKEAEYDSLVNDLNMFFKQRFSYISEYMKRSLNLTGRKVSIVIENDIMNGNVELNSSSLLLKDNVWSGQYFTDYPVTIKANAVEGHEFSYFELSNGEKIFDSETELTLTDDITIKAVYDEYIDSTEFISSNIILSGNIGVNLYARLSDSVISDPDAFVLFTAGETELNKIKVSDITPKDYNGSPRYVFRCNLNSTQVYETVKAQVISENYVSKPISFSVYNLISKYYEQTDEAYTKLFPLLKSLSVYGAYSSAYFNGSELSVSDEDKALLDSVDQSELISYKNKVSGILPEGISYYGSSLLLNSETTIRHYFELESGRNIDDYSFKLKTSSGQQELPVVKKNGRYCVEIPNIAAANLGKSYKVVCGNYEIEYSAMSYVYSVLNKGKADTALQDLLKSVYLYYKEAYTYKYS